MYSNKSLATFDINLTIKTLNLLPVNDRGKSVYNTSLIETVWSHHSTFFNPKLKPKIVQDSEGMQIHARYFFDFNETLAKDLVSCPSIFSLKKLTILVANFETINFGCFRDERKLSAEETPSFPESNHRHDGILESLLRSHRQMCSKYRGP